MSDLVEWYLEQLNKSAADQRDITRRWHGNGCSSFAYDADYKVCECRLDLQTLADIEAKRRIVAEYVNVCLAVVADPFDMSARIGRFSLGLVLRHLAEALADRPGYREEWRP